MPRSLQGGGRAQQGDAEFPRAPGSLPPANKQRSVWNFPNGPRIPSLQWPRRGSSWWTALAPVQPAHRPGLGPGQGPGVLLPPPTSPDAHHLSSIASLNPAGTSGHTGLLSLLLLATCLPPLASRDSPAPPDPTRPPWPLCLVLTRRGLSILSWGPRSSGLCRL